jgi:hypothetical protein
MLIRPGYLTQLQSNFTKLVATKFILTGCTPIELLLTHITVVKLQIFTAPDRQKFRAGCLPPQGTTNRDIRDAYIEDSSIAPNMLKGYEHRTIRTSVMIGKEFQSKPAGFNGMFIPWATYRQWALSGYPGVRYWITLEGYDYKLDDDYNIYVPIEIMFPSNLDAQGDYPVNIGDDDDTNPYDAL